MVGDILRNSTRLQPWVRVQENAIETVSTVSQSQEIKSSFGGNMAHALVRVFIHFVWSTKHGKRLLLGDSGEHVRNHIEEYAWQHSMGIVQLAVQPEHVHLLAPLSRTQPIEDIVGRIKGESSHWINQTNLIRSKFSWQTGYWAGSVCFQHVDQVKTYIQGQQEHHRVKSFREEFEEILRRDGYSEDQIAMLLEGVSR